MVLQTIVSTFMDGLIGLAIIGGLIFGVVELLKRREGSAERDYTYTTSRENVSGYMKKGSILNTSEKAFFHELRKQLPAEYLICPQVRIADILRPLDGSGYYFRRNKILPKSVDFLICDSDFRPKVAIEVNGSSHRRTDREERDELVRRIFTEAGIPLEFVSVGTSFSTAVQKVLEYV